MPMQQLRYFNANYIMAKNGQFVLIITNNCYQYLSSKIRILKYLSTLLKYNDPVNNRSFL